MCLDLEIGCCAENWRRGRSWTHDAEDGTEFHLRGLRHFFEKNITFLISKL